MNDSIGTIGYCAPEIILAKPYSYEVDMWSLGIIIYRMISANLPFEDDSEDMQLKNTIKKHVNFPDHDWRNISNEIKTIILRLLNKK